MRKPNTKELGWVIECEDETFLDFLNQCLTWNPKERITAPQALRHQWILDGLPPNILIHHMNLHNIKEEELPTSVLKDLHVYQEE